MKNIPGPFTGFSQELFNFLKDLRENNSIEWFHENKVRYQEYLVKPAKSYVGELADFFNKLNPAIRTEPKFNKTLMRINKDMRFAKGDPYRDYFLIHFGKFKMDSEFFLYFEADEFQIGLFINNSKGDDFFFKDNFKKHQDEIRKVFEKNDLNKKYDLYELDKEPIPLIKKFDAGIDLDELPKLKYLLFQKVHLPNYKTLFSDELLVESVKIFSSLYPLYIFAISPNPLKELRRFEDNFGITF